MRALFLAVSIVVPDDTPGPLDWMGPAVLGLLVIISVAIVYLWLRDQGRNI